MRHDASAMTLETIVEIRTTFGSREAAEACASRLVECRVAACVQVDGPITSVYRWEGAVERAVEWRCSCKTAADRETACLDAISAGHEYRTPQLVVVRLVASAAYAEWVRECTAKP
jgi:periplasmic divalent cation tolerance protein